MQTYYRKTKELKENKESKILKFLYNTKLGRIILKKIISKKFSIKTSKIIKSKISAKYINKFIKKNNINMSDYEKATYASFDDFFIRKIIPSKRPQISDKNILTSVADSRLTVYDITSDLEFEVKHSVYTINELVKDDLNNEYANGKVLVFRLAPDDYHHYNYPTAGKLLKHKVIEGVLHTVNPISYDLKVFSQNQREVSYLDTKEFGKIIMIEVGALNVGKIHNLNKKFFNKNEEKGFFSFGGSTIILIFKNKSIIIDKDIEENSKKGIETRILLNEKIGKKY